MDDYKRLIQLNKHIDTFFKLKVKKFLSIKKQYSKNDEK